MGLKHSSRVVDDIDKINRLQSRYVESSEEIGALKERKKEIKEKLRDARLEYDAIKGMNLSKSERALRKADKKMTIDGLEQVLERTREEVHRLERHKDRAFDRREKIKGRTVRKMSFEGSGSGNHKEAGRSVLAKNKVGDVAAVAKMMELMRVGSSPSSQVTSLALTDVDQSIDTATKAPVVSKLKAKVINEDLVMEKTAINTGKKRAATIKLK